MNTIFNSAALAIISASLLLPAVSFAELEEIIVTAQKRQESLQDVPIAVTAFTADTLNALGVNDVTDVVKFTPGLTLSQQNGSNRNYFLRGVGTFDFHLTAASAVGQYFDGITLTSGFHARSALFDMERVEVLKGPQNTLFGLNTTGGAVNYISRKPEIGDGLNGAVSGKLGNDSHLGIDVAIGFDNGKNLAGRIAVHTNRHDGPYEAISDGQKFGADNLVAYRATLLWQPTDATKITFNMHGSSNDNDGAAVRAVGTRTIDNNAITATNTYGLVLCSALQNTPIDYGQMTNCVSRGNRLNGQAPVNPSTNDWKRVTQDLGFEDLYTLGYYLKVDHAFDFATLNLSLAMDNLEVQTALDGDGGPTALLNLQQEDDRDTQQYEIRLISLDDAAFRWIAGIYYLDDTSDSYTGVNSPGFPGPPVSRGIRVANIQLDTVKTNLGVYAQGEVDFSDALTLTVGLRSSDEEIIGDYLPSAPVATSTQLAAPIFSDTIATLVRQQFAGQTGFDANGYEIARKVRRVLDNNDIGYTIKLDYKMSEDSLLYFSVSKGFKGGAIDTRAAYALVPVANVQTSLDAAQIDPESLDAYEIGYKSAFGENINLDVAVFQYTYQNLQQFITPGGIPSLDNAPESEITGLDGNLRYATDRGFYLDLGWSFLNSEVTDGGNSPNFFAGAELSNAPDMSLSLLASQEISLSGNLLTLTGGISHTGDQLRRTLVNGSNQIGNLLTEPAHTIVNTNVAYRFGEDQKYNLAFFIDNVLDENFCGGRVVNDSNGVLASNFNHRALSYNAVCRTSRAATRTLGVSFNLALF